jgi:uncharacterized membrane protein
VRSRDLRRLRFSAAFETLRASLWFVPSLLVAAAVVAAALLNRIDIDEGSALARLVFPGGAESARAILQVIAGSVITVTGVVFSLTVVTLQLASTQFSPRLLRTFLRDLSNQVVLGTFLATFTYALLVLRAVDSGPGADDQVPSVAITGAYVLTAASVIALVYFIDHIARSIRIDSLMREVNEDTLEVLDRIHPPASGDDEEVDPEELAAPADAVGVPARRSGFIQGVDDEVLLQACEAEGVVLRLEHPVGDRVIAESPLASVWRPGGAYETSPELQRAVAAAVQIGYERTMQQDVAFGVRQLVDVAVKALSPGINDPTTAEHAIGHLASLLTSLSRRDLRPLVRRDDAGRIRSIVPVTDLPRFLDLACGQIRRYGASEPTVMRDLLRMLGDVARCDLPPAHAEAVMREADMVMAAAERSTPEPRDLTQLHDLHRDVHALIEACRPAEGRSEERAAPSPIVPGR